MEPELISFDRLRMMTAGVVEVPSAPGTGTSTMPLLLVSLDGGGATGSTGTAAPLPSGFPAVVIGLTTSDQPEGHPGAAWCDVALAENDPALAAVVATVTTNPLAATALVQILRGSENRSLDDGLLLESAVYSTLQAGPEFAHWRAERAGSTAAGTGGRRRPNGPDGTDHHGDSERAEAHAVEVERTGNRLDITLARPHVRNALDTAMRDELTAALRLAAADDAIAEVHLWGAGPSFCAGGDLDEFGSFPDPATAHFVRHMQSAGRALAAVTDRATVHLHGACVGSGIEIPAFAGSVAAAPDTTIALPEVSLGLIPGAGGTWSIPQRIGRHRTARLALGSTRVDAATALAWGLVDHLTEAPHLSDAP